MKCLYKNNIFANLSASLKFSTDGRKHGLFLAFFSIVRVLFCQWEVFLDFGEGIEKAKIFGRGRTRTNADFYFIRVPPRLSASNQMNLISACPS
jgi:hypothetical protein